MKISIEKMKNDGWTVLDVSKYKDKGYDLFFKKGNEKIYCEVKGTTGNKTRIILTRNEVLAAENNYPNGALFIVSGIYLNRSKTPPEASLGKLTELYNWKIDNSKLTPISYYYLIK